MTICVSPIKAEILRVTRLDDCGVPILGPSSAQVTADAFTEIQNQANYEEGQRFLQRKANGAPCVNQRDPGFFNWLQQTVSVCTLDPDMLTVVTGDRVISTTEEGGEPEHTGAAFGEGLLTARFSVEVWQPIAGEGACDAEGTQRYVYWAFPNVGDAQIQDFTFQNDVFTFGWQDTTRSASPLWDIGEAWLGDDGGEWGPGEHFAFNITTEPPPAAACGAVTLPYLEG